MGDERCFCLSSTKGLHTMRYLLTIAALALSVSAAQAASECKGLEQAVCTGNAACRWIAARKVGDLTKKGEPSKTAAKAHCTTGRTAAKKS